jgi:hypothetical protein
VESNWVHSALRPPVGLLCQPWVVRMMERLVEWWLAGETEVLGENLAQCRFVYHKPHMPALTRTGVPAVGSQRLTAWATARATSVYGSTVLLLDLGCFFSFLILYTVVRTSWTGISPSQGRYLHTERRRRPCLEWDSNPRSQRSSERRQFMP